ncbi:MAG: hypothetical protein ACI8RD_002401 [Bacillariaceae sp.]|jgi:hypothetical protein
MMYPRKQRLIEHMRCVLINGTVGNGGIIPCLRERFRISFSLLLLLLLLLPGSDEAARVVYKIFAAVVTPALAGR